MFGIFSKKIYLKDYLDGLVDVHCHILPGIDDGAQTVEDSIEIIKSLNNIGIRKHIPTPHIMEGFYANTKESIENSYALLLEGKSIDKKNIITFAFWHGITLLKWIILNTIDSKLIYSVNANLNTSSWHFFVYNLPIKICKLVLRKKDRFISTTSTY